jgi:hypothetical protein
MVRIIADTVVTIHVTQCQRTQIHVRFFSDHGGSCQQIRCHDSQSVEWHLLQHEPDVPIIRGGAILEQCTDIAFHVSRCCTESSVTTCHPSSTTPVTTTDPINNDGRMSSSSSLLDVKDFDWLRTDAPSPNFRIVYHDPCATIRQPTATVKEVPESNISPGMTNHDNHDNEFLDNNKNNNDALHSTMDLTNQHIVDEEEDYDDEDEL